MINTCVQLNSADEAISFVNEMRKCPFEADMQKGSCTIDAKSILGVISVAVGREMDLKIYADNADELLGSIAEFVKPSVA